MPKNYPSAKNLTVKKVRPVGCRLCLHLCWIVRRLEQDIPGVDMVPWHIVLPVARSVCLRSDVIGVRCLSTCSIPCGPLYTAWGYKRTLVWSYLGCLRSGSAHIADGVTYHAPMAVGNKIAYLNIYDLFQFFVGGKGERAKRRQNRRRSKTHGIGRKHDSGSRIYWIGCLL
jgi:hypothetical protein